MSCEGVIAFRLAPTSGRLPLPWHARVSSQAPEPFTMTRRGGRALDVYVGTRYLAAAQVAGMKPRSPVFALEAT